MYQFDRYPPSKLKSDKEIKEEEELEKKILNQDAIKGAGRITTNSFVPMMNGGLRNKLTKMMVKKYRNIKEDE